MTPTEKIMAFIETCDDREKLKTLIDNAKLRDAPAVEQAAFRRLLKVSPAEAPGTIEHDLWSTIFAFEYLLKQERGKTVLLARTRQKIGRVGVVQTLADWAQDTKETDGFNMLLERGMLEHTGEAIVLRHAKRFPASIVQAARSRLAKHTSDPAILRPGAL